MRELHDSGIEWIGIAPSSWKAAYLSSVLSERKHKNVGMKEDNLLSLSYGNVKQKDINTNDGLLPESFEGYNIIEDGDIVLRLTDLQNDHRSLRTGLCRERGIITSAYCTLKRNNDKDDPRFLRYYLHCFDLCKGFYGMGAGVRQGLNFDGIRKIEVLLPTPVEQTAISDYLDAQMEKVDALIANQQAQIEKLKQYKQSLITEVVTKGLDPNAPIKDSGVEWIGKIANGHQIYRLKFLLTAPMMYGANESGSKEAKNSVRYIRITDITTDSKLKDDENNLYLSLDVAKDYLLVDGDVLFARSGGTVGKSFIYRSEYGESAFAGYLIKAECNTEKLLPEYLFYYTLSSLYEQWKNMIFIQATIQNIGASKYSNMEIVVPSMQEQKHIVEFLARKCRKIDRLIDIKNQKIEKLNDYKKSLIYEYVTGKKEVVL